METGLSWRVLDRMNWMLRIQFNWILKIRLIPSKNMQS
jgi:hypothetical protein